MDTIMVGIFALLTIGFFWSLTAIGVLMFVDRDEQKKVFAKAFLPKYIVINTLVTFLLVYVKDFRANMYLGIVGAICYGFYLQHAFKKVQK